MTSPPPLMSRWPAGRPRGAGTQLSPRLRERAPGRSSLEIPP